MTSLSAIKEQLSQNPEIGKTPQNIKKLPKITSKYLTNKITTFDRLYYGNKKAKKYGKIPNLLNNIKKTLPLESIYEHSNSMITPRQHLQKEKYDDLMYKKKLPKAELIGNLP